MALRHYTDDIGRRGIERLGLITPGADGLVYLTPDSYDSAAAARAFLALNRTPSGYLEIPEERVGGAGDPQPVAPAHRMPGGGTEVRLRRPIQASGLRWTEVGP